MVVVVVVGSAGVHSCRHVKGGGCGMKKCSALGLGLRVQDQNDHDSISILLCSHELLTRAYARVLVSCMGGSLHHIASKCGNALRRVLALTFYRDPELGPGGRWRGHSLKNGPPFFFYFPEPRAF